MHYSWAMIWRGVFAILFGLTALLWSGATITVLVLWFGAFTFISGVFTSLAALNAASLHSQWGIMLVSGLLSVVVGLIALGSPVQMALAFVWVLGAWALFTGVFEVATGLTSPWIGSRKWLLVFAGMVSIAFGYLLMANPVVGAQSLVWIMGGYALLVGALFLVMGFRFKTLA